jgi:hypothetical protein
VNKTNKPDIVSFDSWISSIGRSQTTGWRWRRKGWIETFNIAGRLYVQRDEIDRFNARAARGEFAQAVTIPSRELSV